MTSRLRILLVIGAAIVLAAYLALPRVMERIYEVEEWEPAWPGEAWIASGWIQHEPRRPRITFGYPVPKTRVERWDLDSGPTLVLRWSDGRFSWRGKEIEDAAAGSYVSGLLEAKKMDYVLVLVNAGASFGEVMKAADKLHDVKARAIMLSEER